MFSMMRGNPVNRYILYITASFKIVDHICNPGTLLHMGCLLTEPSKEGQRKREGCKEYNAEALYLPTISIMCMEVKENRKREQKQ